MVTENFILKYAQNFVNSITSKGINLTQAKLFGSYSKGEQNESSDIDILLVSDQFKGVGFIDNALIYQELFKFDKVHVKTYSTIDYETGDSFLDEINTHAITLNF